MNQGTGDLEFMYKPGNLICFGLQNGICAYQQYTVYRYQQYTVYKYQQCSIQISPVQYTNISSTVYKYQQYSIQMYFSVLEHKTLCVYQFLSEN